MEGYDCAEKFILTGLNRATKMYQLCSPARFFSPARNMRKFATPALVWTSHIYLGILARHPRKIVVNSPYFVDRNCGTQSSLR